MAGNYVPQIAVKANVPITMSLSVYLFSILGGLVGALIYAFKVNKNKSKTQLLILGLIAFVACFELYAIYLVNNGRHNRFVYNICFIYLETFLILGYLSSIIESKKIRKIILYFSLTFLIWGVINSVFIQDIWLTWHNYSFLLASLSILTFSLAFLYGITKNNEYLDRPLLSIPHFWNASILLVFYSSAFLYFISADFLTELDPKLVAILGSFNRTVAGIMYIVLGFSYYAPLLQSREYAK
jgi:hypothetical protein